MLKIIKGDILNSNCNVICHQVNEDGYMGGGLALSIATRYPEVEKEYNEYCGYFEDRTMLYGDVFICEYDKDKYIANCFTQRNFITSIEDIKQVFNILVPKCKKLNLTIAVPYNYGCGIARGNWQEVYETLEDISNKYEYDIEIYQLED